VAERRATEWQSAPEERIMHTFTELRRYKMHAADADVGGVEDVYFDDQDWVVRHLVVDSRHWIRGRRVLIPPPAVQRVDEVRRRLEVALTRAQIERSPTPDTAKPVSRQHHVDLYSYYGCPYDWNGTAAHRDPLAGIGEGDLHLRSARAVTRYQVQAVGGEVGSVDDFLIEMPSWAIRYIAVRSGHRLGSRHVLVSPGWVIGVSWEGRLLDVDLSAGVVAGAPEYDPLQPADRAYEARLHDYYHRLPYWRRAG
jgi:hypothetical protein